MTSADKPACECHFCDGTGYIDGAQCIACFERENAKPPEPAPPCPRCDERHADDPDACLRDGYKMPKPEGREALPECPHYIAHPQSVWFNEHWRPKLEIATAALEWALKQDWSFDNHGPEGLYTRLSETLSELKQEN